MSCSRGQKANGLSAPRSHFSCHNHFLRLLPQKFDYDAESLSAFGFLKLGHVDRANIFRLVVTYSRSNRRCGTDTKYLSNNFGNNQNYLSAALQEATATVETFLFIWITFMLHVFKFYCGCSFVFSRNSLG